MHQPRLLTTMTHLPRFPAILVVFFLIAHVPARHGNPLPSTYDGSICSKSFRCGGVEISYPFYLANATRAANEYGLLYSCGYTDLKISCQGAGKTATPLVQLGQYNYTVKDISYNKNTILLVDADAFPGGNGGCPNVRHNVSLLGSDWLRYTGYNDNLTFFLGCYQGEPGAMPPGLDTYKVVNCPGLGNALGGGPSFVFSSEEHGASGDYDLADHCHDIVVVPVLSDSLARLRNNQSTLPGGFGGVMEEGFELAWMTADDCYQCEQSRGRCAYSQNKVFMGCLCSDEKVGMPDCNSKSGASSAGYTSRSKNRTATIAGVAAGGFSLLLVGGVIAFFVIRKRKQKKGVNSSSKLLKYSGSGGTPYSRGGDTESGSIQDLQTHLFSYEELEEATDRFNDNRELGDGGFGTVYKGFLKDGRVVAVKRLYNNSYRRVEQFVNEAAILSRLRHPNLVMFYGCTSSNSRELLLVYEFVANGTVADHLHGHRAPERALSWPLRLNIAVESAAALTYLHAIEPPIVHRDVKTTNILLDADYHVKVADFGLSRLFPVDVTHVSTAPQGTPGYFKSATYLTHD